MILDNIKYELDKKNKTATVLGFYDFDKILNVLRIPKSVKHWFQEYTIIQIKPMAFYSTPIEKIYLPSTLKTIGTGAFGACDFLQNVSIEQTANNLIIGTGAFAFCRKLKKISGTTTIELTGSDHFQMCRSLTEFEPTIFGKIPSNAFYHTTLRHFVFNNSNIVSRDAFEDVPFNSVTLMKDVGFENFEAPFIDSIQAETIFCQSDSPFVNLAFDGYCVKIYD